MSRRQPVVEGDRLVKVLIKLGFELLRISGSAHILRHPDGRQTSVHVHVKSPLKTGTLAAILKDVGLSAEELRRLL